MVVERKSIEQLGIIVLDGSGSMKEPDSSGEAKAASADRAAQDLIKRLQQSIKKDNFFISVITYDDKAILRLKPTQVTNITLIPSFDPLEGHGGQTNIGGALQMAYEVAQGFLSEESFFERCVVIVLMTDGKHNTGQNPNTVVSEIKKSELPIMIATVGFGRTDDIDVGLLEEIASTTRSDKGEQKMFKLTNNPEELRNFFLASVTTSFALG